MVKHIRVGNYLTLKYIEPVLTGTPLENYFKPRRRRSGRGRMVGGRLGQPMKPRVSLRGKRGLSIIEIIVSIAVLALLTLLVISVFSAAVSIIGRQTALQRDDNDAAAGVENYLAGFEPDSGISVVTEQPGSLSVDFGGTVVTEDGVLVKGTDDDNKSVYYYFSPDS